ncbi:MAG: tagaturonate epimerase family protein [Planctomycetota bacterium]|nr:tagaturonate epimerase family protein [Planctomycetota bacterium]
MGAITRLLESRRPTEPLGADVALETAGKLSAAIGMYIYPASICGSGGTVYCLARVGTAKKLVVIRRTGASGGEDRELRADGDSFEAEVFDADGPRAAALRSALPFTAPVPLGIRASIGLGDRLGLAGPGHIRSVRGSGVVPVLAQQSIRELTRTGRTPVEVMDAATWAVFQEGWREPFGSDADHLKTPEDVDIMAEAGFTMFTIDPGAHVDNAADSLPASELRGKAALLPWNDLCSSEEDCRRRYAGLRVKLDGGPELRMSEEAALRAAVKYGRAVAHTAAMARRVAEATGGRPFEIEMSVDETESPTSPEEHYYVASELKRLGVHPVSLAPRFAGRFEKGVDYIGDLAEFERTFAMHAAVARTLGPYKISIHSGSDKFAIYGIAARQARGLIHVKTAGTSYLEALRTLAGIAPDLFREILDFARERYGGDKASYHVSADPAKVPSGGSLPDDRLESVLDSFDGREVLHVTFGSVLTARSPDGSFRFRDRMLDALRREEEKHYLAIERHLSRHVAPFARGQQTLPGNPPAL